MQRSRRTNPYPFTWEIPLGALVATLALAGSFLVAWAVRQVPPLRRLFS